MQFLYPGVLWALGLIAVPIIIHLFNFRRVKKIYFSNTTFLQQVRKETNRQSQIKRLLILLARVLFIIFLVLAFAQPMSTANEHLVKSYRKIYLDNSLSMSRLSSGGITLLDESIQMVDELVKSREVGLQYSLTTNDFLAGSSRFLTGKEIQERLTEVDYSQRFRQLTDVVSRMDVDHSMVGTEYFLISDFQKTSSLNIDHIFEDSLMQLHLIRLVNEDGGNLFIDSVYLEASIGLSSTNKLHISVQNVGEQDRSNVLIKVFRDSIQFSTFTMDIGANSLEDNQIDIGGFDQMSGSYLIEIEDNAQIFDNRYFFTVDKPKKIQVSIISEQQQNKFLNAAFSNPEIFVLNNFSSSNLDYEAIRQSDLIILSGLSRIPEWLESGSIENASLLVIPGVNIDLKSYERLLQLGLSKSNDSVSMNISKQSLSSPFFEGVFSNIAEQISLPWMKNTLIIQGYHTAILNTNLNRPFMIKAGQSNIFFFTVPLNDAFTDFHKHALFIPVLYKLSQSINTSSQRLAYSFDDQLIPLKGLEFTETSVPRISNASQSFVPEVIRTKEGILLDIPAEIEIPGIYSLTNGQDTITNLAFNYNKAESDINTLSKEELQQLASGFKNVHIYDVNDVEDFKRTLSEINEGIGLWKYALLLALVFIFIEMLLLRFTK